MKNKRLSDYLALMKSATDKRDWAKVKHHGEIALKKLSRLAPTPSEKFSLYQMLGRACGSLLEYSRSLDFAYKAHLIATKHHLKPAERANISQIIMSNLLCLRNLSQAFVHFQKVEQYYQKYGTDFPPMGKETYVATLLFMAYYYYLYKKDLKKMREILEEKLLPYQAQFSSGLHLMNYLHVKGEYLIAAKDYEQATQYFQKCIAESKKINDPRYALEAEMHLAGIALRKNQLDRAIVILENIFKNARRQKIKTVICEAGIVLRQCYLIKGKPDKAKKIEQITKSFLNGLDTVWLYETRCESEEFFAELPFLRADRHSVEHISGSASGEETLSVAAAGVLTDTIEQRREISSYKNFIGKSVAIQGIYQLLEKIAPTDLPVLIQGETGTGKELIAAAIHQNSPRKNKTFLAFNCGTIPETLIESHLFGHAKGAFTGADEDKKGYIELASGGTLFIDEIASMPLSMQQKLLRVIEEPLIRAVGSEMSIKVDTRFIFASNQSIEELVQDKLFRSDFFYRINTIVVDLPPLTERTEDIPLLINHFFEKYAKDNQPKKISPDLLDIFLKYQWPGNVRELESKIRRICILYPDVQMITKSIVSESILKDLKHSNPAVKQDDNIRSLKDGFEKNIIMKAINKCDGNLSETARRLGYSRRHLYTKIKQLNIRPEAVNKT